MPSFATRTSLLLIVLSLLAADAIAQDAQRDHFRKQEMQRAGSLAKRQARTLAGAADYDVISYRLTLAMPMLENGTFGGNVVMRMKSTVDGLSNVVVNAGANLRVDSVTSEGAKLLFTHVGDTLKATLASPASKGAAREITMYYSAPYTGSAIAAKPVTNVPLNVPTLMIASQSEPYDARNWWPCKDDPADKADTVDLICTTDSSLFCVSNGSLVSDVKHADGTRTIHWRSTYPIATYLVSVALAQFSSTETTFTHGGKTMPVNNWWYSMQAAQMQPSATAMMEGLQFFSDRFITYPFINEKYSMAEYGAFGGAMEHQTCTSMGFYGVGVTIHELAHQWFGDKVTCANFEHIWLNEGWATYCEALFEESKGGLEALKNNMAGNAYFGPGTIYVYDALDKNMGQIFSGDLSYNKASWVVHMLRHVVGDRNFFPAVNTYLGSDARENCRSVTTQEFQGFLERESGMNLTQFFKQWIYGDYFPTYRLAWTSSPSGGVTNVTVTIDQLNTPTRQVFHMPIDLTFSLPGGDTTVVVHDSLATQVFTFAFSEKPTTVRLDKDNWILKRVVQPISNPTFDKGILLVNGVDWDTYATDPLKQCYEDSVFTGDKPYTFWDLFPNPGSGYPRNITAPAGIGAVPPEELGKYCTVVWVGNAYGGDEAVWQNSNIWEYLKAGGNVILLTRQGRLFITAELVNFTGLTWSTGQQPPLEECKAEQTWLMDLAFTGEQSLVHAFQPALSRSENEILFSDSKAFASKQALGLWAKPMSVGGKQTGQMVYIGVRPYRVSMSLLKPDMQTILDRMPCVPLVNGTDAAGLPQGLALAQNYPNPVTPANSTTAIDFTVPGSSQMQVTLAVFDALGRRVALLVDAALVPGSHHASLDTRPLSAGVYTIRLSAGGSDAVRTMTVVK
ncbi:MAG: T9SS type A sorting domain-containing protein [Ignavibacteria bacterium]|nr:T9SS type A sorting domain-containing protein [Ignavibacteria bacterium]